MTFELPITEMRKTAQSQPFFTTYGKVSEVVGLLIKVEGLTVFIGEICEVAMQHKTNTALA